MTLLPARTDVPQTTQKLAPAGSGISHEGQYAVPRAESLSVAPAAEASMGERLQYGLRAALRKLDDLVQIRRRDEPYKPLLAPQYEAALQQNIRLAFEQAQVALLLSNQKLYEHSLNKAREALLTYYTVDEHATQVVAQAIADLAARRVAMALPDISQSRRELKAYLNARRLETATAADLPKVQP